ncbi:DUF602-domain-containing protein [Tothia fuscella]|uniref:DUF602-domain-containing protein n=1 Tax=Tothia fuscella TaxID=1048955 RepID=A0A9P4TZ98_9PEZI|nr:DUF602-domain-containing protein [Tothia fuscella]
MGNDGGSIPKRTELVREAARNPTAAELKETQQEQEEYFWTTDPITNTSLGRTVVSDCNGKLYNKESIVTFLLPSDNEAQKAEAGKVLAGAVRSLKDVVEVKFEEDVQGDELRNANGSMAQKWICSITNKRLGPGSKAVYLVPCGHAFSGAAIKEVADDKCLQCGEAYAPNDVISIIPTSEVEIARLTLRMKTLKEKGLAHSLKKASGSKKRKKNAEAEILQETNGEEKVPELVKASTTKSANGTNPAANEGIKNASTASLTAKVLAEQEKRNKKRKMAGNSNLSSLYSSRDQSKPIGKSSDFMTRGFSIPGGKKG